MAARNFFTAEMVRALPDDGSRYETVHGELLVTPAPVASHQYVIRELLLRIGNYLQRHPVGQVFTAPADISWAPDILVQPDLFVVEPAEAATLEWGRMRSLLLAVEILSPSSRRQDRFTKRRVYQEYGVQTYWAVSIEDREVEIWTPGATFPQRERDHLVWHPAGSDQALVIAVAEALPAVS